MALFSDCEIPHADFHLTRESFGSTALPSA
jgi:hypothetical protein